MGVLASKEHRPIGTAHRIIADSMREDNALGSKVVEIGSDNSVLIHIPYCLLAKLVGKYEYKVRSFLCHLFLFQIFHFCVDRISLLRVLSCFA